MSIVALLNDPFQDDHSLQEWMFQHANDHLEILQAVQEQFNVVLDDYVLQPFSQYDLQPWLIRHQSMHNAFNGYLLLDGQDLNQIDFTNKTRRQEWVDQNYEEHFAARTALGI